MITNNNSSTIENNKYQLYFPYEQELKNIIENQLSTKNNDFLLKTEITNS